MNNSDIESELMRRFGLEKTMMFAEMAGVMFDMLYKHAITYTPEEPCDFEFDRDWWTERHTELVNMYKKSN